MAILYRTEAQALPLMEALGRAGIPYQKRSHRPLAEQPGMRALLPWLQRQPVGRSNPSSTAPWRRLDLNPALLVAVDLLRPLALRAGDDLEGFLAGIALGGEVDAWDPRAEGVSLLTLHASKGLEFPVVFLVGCEEGLLPLAWPGTDTAEERRLFFVGLTRARSRLFLSHCRKRILRGEAAEARPSRFLADLEAGLLDLREEPVLAPRRPEQLRLL